VRKWENIIKTDIKGIVNTVGNWIYTIQNRIKGGFSLVL
jgi:hypothetical protein